MTAIAGARLYLRELQPSDAAGRYLAWMNDPEVTRFLETRFSTHSEAGIRQYIESVRQDPAYLFLAIVLRDGDRHIGNIKMGPISRVHGYADVGLLIGEKDCWGRGYAAEAIALLTAHAFETGIRKLTAGCYADNVGSLKAFQKAGWHVEGVRRAQYICDGELQDGILMAAFNPAFAHPAARESVA
jgi:[ribosomal protein S5]-alanine N-acetyltransferase